MSKTTAGLWEVVDVDNDGEYGGGPDPQTGFKSYAVVDEFGNTLFDSLNRDTKVTEIHEDGDDDGHSAWDERARVDLTLAAAAPALLKALADLVEIDKMAMGLSGPFAEIFGALSMPAGADGPLPTAMALLKRLGVPA